MMESMTGRGAILYSLTYKRYTMFGWTDSVTTQFHTILFISKWQKQLFHVDRTPIQSEQSDSGPKFCAKSKYEVEIVIPKL